MCIKLYAHLHLGRVWYEITRNFSKPSCSQIHTYTEHIGQSTS